MQGLWWEIIRGTFVDGRKAGGERKLVGEVDGIKFGESKIGRRKVGERKSN